MYGALEIGAGAEAPDQFEGRPHGVEGRDLQDPRIVQIDDALILIFLEQRFEHGARLGPYFVKTSRLRTLSARSRRVSGGRSKAA